MKKKLSFLFAFLFMAVLISAASFEVSAETSGTCGLNLTWTLTDDGTLTISGTGAMYDYTGWSSDSAPWDSNSDNIKKVTIGSGVTTIGSSAFYDCTELTGITIPESVTSIGDDAFRYCTGLTGITIPESVTSIGDDAFYSCTGLTGFKVAAGNNYYSSDEYGALFDKNKTKLIQYPVANNRTAYAIPNSVTTIGDYAFYYCDGLTSITIPNSVTTIGYGAFYRCTKLTGITIPESVTKISYDAFRYCTGLTGITIPESVTSIGDDAFRYCTGLTGFKVAAGNNYYSNDEYGALFDKNKTKLIQYPAANNRTAYAIPNSVTSIGSFAFDGCTELTSITIPDSVTSIGSFAFGDCTGLTNITIPDSVTSINLGAFDGCTKLTSITIPESVTSIDRTVFRDCTGLARIIFNGNATTLYNDQDTLPSKTVIYCREGAENVRAYAERYGRTVKILCETCTFDQQVADNVYLKTAGTCTTKAVYYMSCVCGKPSESLTFYGDYVHTPVQGWVTDKTTHWHSCANCSAKADAAAHIYDSTADASCNVCSYKRSMVTITYNANGGSYAPQQQKVAEGATVTISTQKPTRSGYVFKGWATSYRGDVVYKAGDTVTVNANITLYAIWSEFVTVSYNANGGTDAPQSQSVDRFGSITVSDMLLTRSGYVFKGWATSSSGEVKYSPGDKFYVSNADITLYAVWVKGITVSYSANGGTDAPEAQTVEPGVESTLTDAFPRKSGYVFKGWATSKTGIVVYKPGGTVILDKNITLYAVWLKGTTCTTCSGTTVVDCSACTDGNMYNTCNTCGGDGTVTANKYITCDRCNGEGTLNNGYIYNCPKCSGTGKMYVTTVTCEKCTNGSIPSPCTQCSGEKTVSCTTCGGIGCYESYKVTYDAAGGQNSPASYASTSDTIKISSKVPTRTNHIFVGWASSADGTKLYQPGEECVLTCDVTFQAVWDLCCDHCKGTGYIEDLCPKCNGTGSYREFLGYYCERCDIYQTFEGSACYLCGRSVYAKYETHNCAKTYMFTCLACNGTGLPSYTPGDVDGDTTITKNDAIHLLMHCFFPTQYPVNQSADFDGNGSVDKNDAIYLLMYCFFPQQYPLK